MTIRRGLTWILLLGLLPCTQSTSTLCAQDQQSADRIEKLERRVDELQKEVKRLQQIVLNDRFIQALNGRHWTQQSHHRHGAEVTYSDDVIWQLNSSHAYQWILSPEPPIWTLGKMDVDATKSPVWIDFRLYHRGDGVRVMPGIIKIEDDRVVLALREDASCVPKSDDDYPERPDDFLSTKQNGVSVFVLTRADAK